MCTVFFKTNRGMAPGNGRRRQVASRHLVCASCSSWIQFDSSGCDTAWAETREGSFTFTCKGCKRVEFLVRELAELREMLVGMKRAVTGHGLEGKEGEAGDREVGLEDKAAETEGRVTTTGVNQDREESAGNIRKEEMIAGVEDEGEIRTEERKVICAGATLMATHTYTRNPESHLGKEIDLQQWDTLIFKGEHAENEHWRLVEYRKWTSRICASGVPGGHPRHGRRGRRKRRDQEGTGERYRGKPDWTGGRTKEELFSSSDRWHLEKVEDFCGRLYSSEDRYKIEQGGGRSSVFTRSKDRACDRESREDHGKRKGRYHTGTHRDEQRG